MKEYSMGSAFVKIKYKNEIDAIEGCPREDFKQQNLNAYRFVFSKSFSEKSFIPLIKQQPKLKNKFDNEQLCVAHSLSMFKSKDEAENHLSNLKERNPNIQKRLGDSLAFGKIEKEHGLIGNIGKRGHFSFFAFENIDLAKVFTIL